MTTATCRTTAPATDPSWFGPVLANIGHDCPGICSAARELGASVWFRRRRTPRQGRADATLVVIDASEYDGPIHRSRQFMPEVNDCVHQDGLRVPERRIDDSGHALTTVSAFRVNPSDHGPRIAVDLVTHWSHEEPRARPPIQ